MEVHTDQTNALAIFVSFWIERLLFPVTLISSVAAALYVIHQNLPIALATLGIPVVVLVTVAIMERVKPYEIS